jgi:pyocin large subunit-like protein
VPFTNGFASDYLLRSHFKKKGASVGAASEADYLGIADAFVGGPLPVGTLECLRPDGDRVRYNPATDYFGVLDTKTGHIRTCFRLPGTKARNLAYFQRNCTRTWP